MPGFEIAAVLLLAAQTVAAPLVAPTPTADAEALGVRLAHAGTLAALMKLKAPEEVENLVNGHPELDTADQERLRAIGAGIIGRETDRLLAAEGHAYAQRLSVEDLRVLVDAAESDAGKHHDAILPGVIAATIAATGQFNFGSETLKAFCAETKKLCGE